MIDITEGFGEDFSPSVFSERPIVKDRDLNLKCQSNNLSHNLKKQHSE